METRRKHTSPATAVPGPKVAEPQCRPSQGGATTGRRILCAVRHPAVPIAAIVLLALGCTAALWAATSRSVPAGDGAAPQKNSTKARRKAGSDLPALRIPEWMLGNDVKNGSKTDPEEKGAGGQGTSDGGKPSKTPQAPPTPPEPPRYLSNAAVPEEISLNHPDAVTDRQIAARGWAKLSDGQRAWVIRRTRAKAVAYRGSLREAHERFIARTWPIAIAVNGQRRFLDLNANLLAATAALDGQLAASYEAVEAAVDATKVFVEEANATWLEFDRVRLPSFYESPNPAWQEWRNSNGTKSSSP